MKTLACLQMLVATLLALVLLPVPAAWAHAQLLSSQPHEHAVLDAAPDSVVLTFNEPVSPLTVRLIGLDGGSAEVPATGGETVTVMLPADLARGTHTLSYRVVSTDGHPIGGSLIFSIRETTGAAMATTGDPLVAIVLWSGKALLFSAMFFGIGGAMFMAVGSLPKRARTIAQTLTVAGLCAAVATLGLQGLDALERPIAGILEVRTWSTAFATSYGFTALVAAAALAVTWGALRLRPGRVGVVLALLAGTLASLSLALSGHASAAAPQWITRPAVFLHIGGILFWLGALLPLWLLLRDKCAEADRTLARFSRVVPFVIAPLVLSGGVLAAIQMGAPGPHWLSAYGAILAAKLGLLVLLFGLALWNRRALTVPTLGGQAAARAALRRSIGWEMLIVLVLLGLVAGWRFTPPPRALVTVAAPVTARTLHAHLMDSSIMAMVTIAPGRAGPVTLHIAITDVESAPKAVQGVAATLSSPTLGIEPFQQNATAVGNAWRIDELTLSLPGTWTVELEIRLGRFEMTRLQTELEVPR